jgi:hypothetical protein
MPYHTLPRRIIQLIKQFLSGIYYNRSSTSISTIILPTHVSGLKWAPFQTDIPITSMRATCPVHKNVHDFIIPTNLTGKAQSMAPLITKLFSTCFHLSSISHPHIRVKHCAYGHSVATLLNPLGGTTVSHEYSLTVARYATVVVDVPSTVRYPANYRLKHYF